jgi:hypothetical protein
MAKNESVAAWRKQAMAAWRNGENKSGVGVA